MDLSPWVYIVLLGAAAVLYGWFIPARKEQADLKSSSTDVEVTLEQYMAEIEQDNQEIVNLIGQMKQETVAKQLAQQEQVTELRQRLTEYERLTTMLDSRLQMLESSAAVQAAASREFPESVQESAPSEQVIEEEQVIEDHSSPTVRERYAELFELYDQGKSIDMVAKHTGMARGEVQLILQLAKREETL